MPLGSGFHCSRGMYYPPRTFARADDSSMTTTSLTLVGSALPLSDVHPLDMVFSDVMTEELQSEIRAACARDYPKAEVHHLERCACCGYESCIGIEPETVRSNFEIGRVTVSLMRCHTYLGE